MGMTNKEAAMHLEDFKRDYDASPQSYFWLNLEVAMALAKAIPALTTGIDGEELEREVRALLGDYDGGYGVPYDEALNKVLAIVREMRGRQCP